MENPIEHSIESSINLLLKLVPHEVERTENNGQFQLQAAYLKLQADCAIFRNNLIQTRKRPGKIFITLEARKKFIAGEVL
ncbi:MAG: hypothetical protein HQM10_26665 [Candidatus Riflebacteria bacterium]|nr:hypothetical protein [Candidatus Riflebacteria bacterium]